MDFFIQLLFALANMVNLYKYNSNAQENNSNSKPMWTWETRPEQVLDYQDKTNESFIQKRVGFESSIDKTAINTFGIETDHQFNLDQYKVVFEKARARKRSIADRAVGKNLINHRSKQFNVKILQKLLKEMHDMTTNIPMLEAIRTLNENVPKFQSRINLVFENVRIYRFDLVASLWSLHDIILEKELSDSDLFSLMIYIFRAEHCTMIECPYKLEITDEMLLGYKQHLQESLEKIIRIENVAFHLLMDVEIIVQFLKNPESIKYIPRSVVYLKNIGDITETCFVAILSLQDDLPGDLGLSIRNYLEIVHDGKKPKHINCGNLLYIITELLKTTTDEEVITELNNSKQMLKEVRDDITETLQNISIDCITFRKCLKSILSKTYEIKSRSLAILINNIIKPNSCTQKNCPWFIETTPRVMDIVKNIQVTIDGYVSGITNLLLKIDFDTLNMITKVEDVMENLLIVESAITDEPFMPFLTTLDERIIAKYDFKQGWFNCLEYVTTGKEPQNVDYRQFIAVTNIIQSESTDLSIIDQINKTLKAIDRDDTDLINFLRDVRISLSADIKKIASGILELSHDRSNDRISDMMIKIFTPEGCTVTLCPWYTEKKTNMAKLEGIASDLLEKAKKPHMHFLVLRKIQLFLQYLNGDNAKSIINNMDINHEISTKEFLEEVIIMDETVDKNTKRDIQTIVDVAIDGKPFSHMTTWDIRQLAVALLDKIKDDPSAVKEIKDFDTIIQRNRQEIRQILKKKRCKPLCYTLPSCLKNLFYCGEHAGKASGDFLKSLVYQCPKYICDWIDEVKTNTITPILTQIIDFKQKQGIISNNLIIFAPLEMEYLPITLSLHDAYTIDKLKALEPQYIPLPHAVHTTIEIFTSDGSSTKLTLDFSTSTIWADLIQLNSGKVAEIDLAKSQFVLILVPIERGIMKYVKFNTAQVSTKYKLKEVAKSYKVLRRKPVINLVDLDGTRLRLMINVDNSNQWSELSSASLDKIQNRGYSVIFWPGEPNGPWRCLAADESDDFIWMMLHRYADTKNVRHTESVSITKRGTSIFDVNVFDPSLTEQLDLLWEKSQVIILDPKMEYVFYVPFNINRILPVNVNISNAGIVEKLVSVSKNWTESFNLTGDHTLILQDMDLDKTPVLINLVLDNMNLVKEFIDVLDDTRQFTDEGEHLQNLIIIPVPHHYIVLQPDLAEVSEQLMEMGEAKPKKGYTTMYIPVQDQTVPIILNFQDPVIVKALENLMERSLQPFTPMRIPVEEGYPLICMGVQDGLDVILIIFEETPMNYEKISKSVKSTKQIIDDNFSVIPFEIGDPIYINLNHEAMIRFLKSLPRPGVKRSPTHKALLPIPIEDSFNLIYIDTNTKEDIADVERVCEENEERGPEISIADDRGIEQHCDLSSETIIEKLGDKIKKIEKIPAANSIVILPLETPGNGTTTYIIDLSDSNIKERIRGLQQITSATSTNKIAIFYSDYEHNPETFILDLDVLTPDILEGITRLVSVNLVPTKIINPIPGSDLIALMVPESKIVDINARNGKLIILDQDNPMVRTALTKLNDPKDPDAIKISLDETTEFPGEDKFVNFFKHDEIWFSMAKNGQAPVLMVPSLNQLKTTSLKIIDNHSRTYQIILDTTDHATRVVLQEITRIAARTTPVALVRGENNNNYLVRLNLNDLEVQEKLKSIAATILHVPNKQSILVLKPETTHDSIILDLKLALVVERLKELSRSDLELDYMIGFKDVEGNQTIVNLDIYDRTIIRSLKDIEAVSRNFSVEPLLIPRSYFGILSVVFGGSSFSIGLDLGDKDVLAGLIGLSRSSSSKGYPISFDDKMGNRIVLFLDLDKAQTIIKLHNLSRMSLVNQIPIYNYEAENRYVIDIPFQMNPDGVHLIRCNASKHGVFKKLKNVPKGKSGSPFELTNPKNNRTSKFYMDLADRQTMKTVKKICKDLVIKPNPENLVVLDAVQKDSVRNLIHFKPNYKIQRAKSAKTKSKSKKAKKTNLKRPF